MDESTVGTTPTAAQQTFTNSRVDSVAGLLLILTPVLLLVALGSFLASVSSSGTVESEVLLSSGWTLLWVFVTAGYLAFAVGSCVVISTRISGVTGRLLGNIALLLIPLVLVALASATYTTRALLQRNTGAAVAQEQIPLAMNIMEASTDGVVLAMGAIFGFILLVLGYVLSRHSSRWRLVGFVGILLGVVSLLTNVGVLITVGEPIIGILAVVVLSLWLVPAGWFVHRNPEPARS